METQLAGNRSPFNQLTLLSLANLDKAIELVEDWLLQTEKIDTDVETAVTLADTHLFRGLSQEDLNYLQSFLVPQRYLLGEYIFKAGDNDTRLYVILSGHVSIALPLDNKRYHRLETVFAGASVGEYARFERNTRSADAIADSEVQVMMLECDRLERDTSAIGQRIRL